MSRGRWLDVLAAQCAARSQATIARELKVSSSTINQVLKQTYKGRLDRIQSRVEGRYMNLVVECPVIGELPRDRCADFQRRKFAATSPFRVQLHHTCPTCPNYQGDKQ